MRILEAAICLSIATGIHAGFWLAAPAMTGTASSGASGNAQVTVLAATPAQAAMISRWQKSPSVSDSAPFLAPLPAPAPAIVQSPAGSARVDRAFRRIDAPPQKRAVLTEPVEMTMPHIDQSAAPPPRKIEPPKPQRPTARPENLVKHTDPTPPQMQQRAVGRAKTTQKGDSGANRTQSDNASNALAMRAKWGAEIHAKVQRNLKYPRGARVSGTAKLALKIAPNGSLKGLSLLQSSGNDLLDKAAIKAVHKAGRFAKAPSELSDAAYAFSLSLTFNR